MHRLDSCRTARRLGADVTIVYRRSEVEMPARAEEIKHAKEEGIHFLTLHNPQKYLADEQGKVCGAILDVMQLGEPDESGRRRPERQRKYGGRKLLHRDFGTNLHPTRPF